MDEETRRAIQRSLLRSAGILIGLFVIFAFLPLRGRWWWVGVLIGLAALGALLPLTFHRLRAVAVSDRPMIDAGEGLVILLGLLVTGFASVYFAMDHDGSQFNGLVDRVDAVYFTVTTLSTVGFGDITATGQAGRILVTVQMLFDLIYIGLSVRVLTSLARRRVDERSSSTSAS